MAQLNIVHQATKEQSQRFEADPELNDLPDVVDRFAAPEPEDKKRKRDSSDGATSSKMVKTEEEQNQDGESDQLQDCFGM